MTADRTNPASGSSTDASTGTTGPAALAPEPEPEPLLRVRGLHVEFGTADRPSSAVRGVDLDLERGQVLGLVGESGSGKSVTALAALGLLPPGARVRGSVRLSGEELIGRRDAELARVRGNRVAMVFQDPLSSFTPVYRIGDQIAETVRVHQGLTRRQARERAVELLGLVGIPEPRLRADAFPHEFSGGMRQRAAIAAAIANDPDVILADEPTTALDVTIQAQILDVLGTARRETGAALLFVSHDLGVVAGFADRVAVMYAGRIVESAPVDELFDRPLMPYTLGLLGAAPRADRAAHRLVPIPGAPPRPDAPEPGCAFAPRCPLAEDACRAAEPPLVELTSAERPGDKGHLTACRRSVELALRPRRPEEVFTVAAAPEQEDRRATAPRAERPPVLRVSDLVRTFPVRGGALVRRRRGTVHAVDGVGLDIRAGETLGLVGESGSGKTTTLFELFRLRAPEGGRIELFGRSVAELDRQAVRELRGRVQMVFQDPTASLDPRMTVADIVAEPLTALGVTPRQARARAAESLARVGLDPRAGGRFAHEFSGGQRQRIGIARALSTSPELVVLDEPVSALDVSVQADVLNLLQQLRAELGLAYLFVSHDLAVIRHVADRVAVVYLGRTVETGEAERVLSAPRHPYTVALLSAVPVPDPRRERARERILLPGDPPSPTERRPGCRFRTRCPRYAALPAADQRRCTETDPPLTGTASQSAACHFPL